MRLNALLILIQAGKAMLSDKEGKVPANILMEDVTSKRRKTYNAVVISTSEGLKNVSLPSLAKEDAETSVSITKDTFDEIADVMGRLEGQKSEADLLKELYLSIKGTMSDSCEVMKKFSRLMSEKTGISMSVTQVCISLFHFTAFVWDLLLHEAQPLICHKTWGCPFLTIALPLELVM